MEHGKIRTRFAPSPTGYMHIGNLRTALYTYLIAKKDEGTFILRIEDTDRERLTEGATEVIYSTLRDTGLDWDEGPDVGGPVGPYIQSERQDLYKEYAEKLIAEDKAYHCFCDKDRLDEVRKIQTVSGITPGYDGRCSHLAASEIEKNLAAGMPYVVRQRMAKEGEVTFHDEIFGDITVDQSELDDQILMKQDGFPTYNFANVVDDHLMGITHVVRGNEYLSSAPKYNLLYEAFGWEVPKYVHCSPVMKTQTEKLSKRNGDASYEDLVKKGYLTEAIINYIALLGWSPKGEQEIFSLAELLKEFDIAGISKSPAMFDTKKLNFINGEYIRKMELGQFHAAALPWIRQTVTREDVNTMVIAKVLHTRTDVLSDIPEQVDFIDAMPEYESELYTHKKMKSNPETALNALRALRPKLEEVEEEAFTSETIFALAKKLAATLEIKNGVILWPLRVALSGKAFTPGGGSDLCEIMGKEETLARVDAAITKLSLESA